MGEKMNFKSDNHEKQKRKKSTRSLIETGSFINDNENVSRWMLRVFRDSEFTLEKSDNKIRSIQLSSIKIAIDLESAEHK